MSKASPAKKSPSKKSSAKKQTVITEYEESIYLPQKHQSFSTKAIHAGQEPEKIFGSVNVPIHLSSTYVQKNAGELTNAYDYTRCGNPTRQALEDCLAALEYGTHSICFASGMGAFQCILHILDHGAHIICSDDVYGGTNRYLRCYAMEKFKMEVSFVDMTDLKNVEKAIKPNTQLVHIETPSNPTMKLTDIAGVCAVVRKKDPKIIICGDNTFATPYLQNPLELGCDIVDNSLSKYIGGHSDLIMGALTVKDKTLYDTLFHAAKSAGANPSPFDCYMALRGVKTLELRMKQHCKNAYTIAKYLETNPLCVKVSYPGLESHPQHKLAKIQMKGYGGMIAFWIKGDMATTKKFLAALKVFTIAESLGGVESLVEVPVIMTHGSVPKEQRDKLGITDNMIRFSCGVENTDDLIHDIQNALEVANK